MENNRVYAKVDIDAILWNLSVMQQQLKPDTRIVAVVKADGYGHGTVPIARVIEEQDVVWGFAVATAEEAFELRHHQIKKPILILGYTFENAYEKIVKEGITPTVFDYASAKKYSDVAVRLNMEVSCHIKIDTGMGRIGLPPDETGIKVIQEISTLPKVRLEGIFTHFARSDEADKTATDIQFGKFSGMVDALEQKGIVFMQRHCANSAAILEYPRASLSLVRAGIILYGLWPSEEVGRTVELHPALSLYSHIAYIKTLPKGSAISYGGTYTLERDTRVATIPVGYADGYCRGLSNKGSVLICGKRAPILGRICMDQFMVDVTDIPSAKILDEVILIGKSGDEAITMEELGDISGRFNYEFACGLGMRIPRMYYRSGQLIETRSYQSVVEN